MYVPAHFNETRPEVIASVLERAPLACLVAQTAEGLVANHLPLFARPDGRLIGHVALANDLHRQLADGAEVLAIFRADDAYVTPNAYPTKPAHHRAVPTWNYEVVHVHGAIHFQHDINAKRRAVGILTRDHEHALNGAAAWRMADAPADWMEGMLASIVAFEIVPARVLAKSKLSQNRDDVDHHGVIENLRARGKAEMAARMAADRPRKDPVT